mmetsp:Transcript_52504/g.77796  ORF Transcript_52504/g.77796 Transcript_52504/m.77796 type:complete len:150 (+) Transcript_52504:455-904(+)
MVLEIFSRSRKIDRMDIERRRTLGEAIHNTSSILELNQLALTYLETSAIFDEAHRQIVADHIFNGRFDKLLLPELFDCDESFVVRIEEGGNTVDSVEIEDCSICLGSNDADLTLTCGHTFCTDCIVSWMNQHGGTFPCPMCRTEVSLEE